jgi:hypothetical protein
MRQEMGYVFAFKLGESHREAKLAVKEYSDRDSFAIDIWSRCTRCGYNCCNGIPLSTAEYEDKFSTVAAAARYAGWGDSNEKLV